MEREISRRTLLKGAGVAMALPWLESLAPISAFAQGKRVVEKPPVRFAALYMPNGVNPHAWTPTGEGRNFGLSSALEPLKNVKDDLLVFSELMNKNSLEGDGHYVKVAPMLCGTAITKTTGSNLRSGGISLDQLIAQHNGMATPLPSLELSIDPPTTYVDTNVGFTALYGSHISWSTPTTPVSREINPQLAFDRLFRRTTKPNASNANDASILDTVNEEAKALRKKVSEADGRKLDEYFDAVRSVETRIAFDARHRKNEYMDDKLARAEIEKLGSRIKSVYGDPGKLLNRAVDHTTQTQIMMDLITLAFWTDSTRVATFMFGNEVSGKNFSFLEGVTGSHHEISHHENNSTKLEMYRRINVWHISQYAYLLERLKSIKEGNGTLLDNSMVLFAGGMKDGNAHDPHNLPIVLGGKAGGTLATGRHIISPKNTPLCSLYLGMLTRAGVPMVHFGDSSEELKGLAG